MSQELESCWDVEGWWQNVIAIAVSHCVVVVIVVVVAVVTSVAASGSFSGSTPGGC